MEIKPSELAQLSQFLYVLAEHSGAIIRRYFRSEIAVDSKSDATPVTLADREAEVCLRSLIQQQYPTHGIVGEEFGSDNPQAEWQWILDPIDGTKSFVAGAFDFGTIVGLTLCGQPVLGMVNHPVLNECYVGDNQQATCNGKRLHVSDSEHLSEAIVLTSDLLRVPVLQEPQGFARLLSHCKFARTWGNCYGYSLVARGLAAVMVDPMAAPWDRMGIIPIIRGAGGVITDYHGRDPVIGDSIIAAAPALHQQVMRVLQEA